MRDKGSSLLLTLGNQRSKFAYLSPELRVSRDRCFRSLDEAANGPVAAYFEIIARFIECIAPKPRIKGTSYIVSVKRKNKKFIETTFPQPLSLEAARLRGCGTKTNISLLAVSWVLMLSSTQ